MTSEEAKKFLPVIQAHIEGKPIQWRSTVTGCWEDISDPSFHGSCVYRVKPVPREFWINIYIDGVGAAHISPEKAHEAMIYHCIETIKVVEVV